MRLAFERLRGLALILVRSLLRGSRLLGLNQKERQRSILSSQRHCCGRLKDQTGFLLPNELVVRKNRIGMMRLRRE